VETYNRSRGLAFMFDVDGVLAETPHEEAWKAAALEWGIITPDYDFTAFYARHVAGEPGIIGAHAILSQIPVDCGVSYFEANNLHDRAKKEHDARQFRDYCKQKHLEAMISAGKFRVFDDTAGLALRLRNDRYPLCAVSSSENARSILHKIGIEDIMRRTGIPLQSAGKTTDLYSIFDACVLGTQTHWHNQPAEKLNHYCYARGVLLGSLGIHKTDIPHVVVFEDAVKGIAAISPYDFICVGISRLSASGARLATKEELLRAGAALAYDEADLREKDYSTILEEIRETVGNLSRTQS
jgi:beta-phosphoglucomutase-like phosphatase (HAD superfamily)